MTAAAAVEYLESHREQAVEQLKELLRIPSVSGDSAFRSQTRQAAEWVLQTLTDAGLDAELVETAGHPIVTASWLKAEGAPTALIYGHYDVQPPDPVDKWTTGPFDPTERDGCLYARGATDDKGQMLTHVLSVAAWLKAVGSLPVNVKFVIEGEEEVGSNNLDLFLEKNRESLRADVAVVSDTSQYAPGMPAITYGLRGVMACEVTVKGPNRDLHSGVFGGSVANPVNGLCRLIAGLHDADGRVAIPGFYDDVIPLTGEERAAFAALPEDESRFYAELGMKAGHGEPGFSALERRWARPTCDVNGIYGGYTGEGPKTIVPSSATAKITCRLVPDQQPAKLMQALKAHLESLLLPGLTMEFHDHHGGQPLVFATDSPWMQAASRAIERAFGTAPVMIREGGSIPVVATFRQLLGIDTLLLGWGQNTDNLHSPDEHFSIADFHRGTAASACLWEELAK